MAAGQYKGKTTNLSAKELKTAVSSAGGKKVSAYKKNLGAATSVDIGKTSFVKGKGLVNSASPNTRITGTVTLGTGEKATYVNGRRLRASDAKPSSSQSSTRSRSVPTSTPNKGGVNTVSNQSLRKPLSVPKSTPNRGGVNSVSNQSSLVKNNKPASSAPSSTPAPTSKPKAGSTTKPSDRFTGSKNQMAGIAGMLGKKAFGNTAAQKRALLAAIDRKQNSINTAKARGAASAAAKRQAAADAAQLAALRTQLRNLK